MIRERDDDDLTDADREVMRLYETESRPIDWDASDDAILAFSREIHAGKAPAAGEAAEDGQASTVVPFAPRKRSFVQQVIHSPATGFAMAACLMIGVFTGQGMISLVDLGVAPGYDHVVQDNKRLQRELNQTQTQLTRSLAGSAATSGTPAGGSLMQLTQALSGFDCASLSATLSKDMKVTVSGYVASDADLKQLGAKLAGFERMTEIVNQAKVAGQPACAMLELLQQKTDAQADLRTLPVVQPFAHGPEFAADEKLVVAAEATPLYDGFLYVDFVQHDGTVLHMLPGPDRAGNAVKAGERVLLGKGPQEYTIAAPFGTEMLVVISSPKPLFKEARPQVEKAEAYLGALRTALDGAGKQVVSNYAFVTTGPRRASK
jgi:Domain of unknown function (DUF4384)